MLHNPSWATPENESSSNKQKDKACLKLAVKGHGLKDTMQLPAQGGGAPCGEKGVLLSWTLF